MIARFTTLLPYVIHVPETPFAAIKMSVNTGQYEVTYWPPRQAHMSFPSIVADLSIPVSAIANLLRPREPQEASNHVLIDGTSTVAADLIQIDIKAIQFERQKSMGPEFYDPDPGFLFTLLNSYLARIRTVTRSFLIGFLDPQVSTWKIEYLDDSGSPLPHDEKLYRVRLQWGRPLKLSSIPPDSWALIRDLPPLYFPERYDVLILDAFAALPDVSASVVLSFTALETLIAHALERLANGSTLVPDDLWKWINDRDDWRKEPSVAEKFSVLLRVLSKKSLIDDQRLWEGFKNLKDARDSFVHEGVARIGKKAKAKVEVTSIKAHELVNIADEIIKFVEALLPPEARTPRSDATCDISIALHSHTKTTP